MTFTDLLELAPIGVPLTVILAILLIVRKADAVVQPIVINVVNGIARQAQSNALGYGLAIGYGFSASLQALAEQATIMQWPLLAAFAKVANPFIVALLAYAAKSEINKAPEAPKTP